MSGKSFHSLIAELGNAHDRDVAALKQKNALQLGELTKLRSELAALKKSSNSSPEIPLPGSVQRPKSPRGQAHALKSDSDGEEDDLQREGSGSFIPVVPSPTSSASAKQVQGKTRIRNDSERSENRAGSSRDDGDDEEKEGEEEEGNEEDDDDEDEDEEVEDVKPVNSTKKLRGSVALTKERTVKSAAASTATSVKRKSAFDISISQPSPGVSSLDDEDEDEHDVLAARTSLQRAPQKISLMTKTLTGMGFNNTDMRRFLQDVFKSWAHAATSLAQTQTFELHDRWDVKDIKRKSTMQSRDINRELMVATSREGIQTTSVQAKKKRCHPDSLIILPNSRERAAWEVIGALMLLYDLIVIPLGSYELPELEIFHVMDWITLIFWTMDIPASCLTAFVQEGETVKSLGRIIRKYVLSWFLLDVVIVGPDWLYWIANAGSGVGDSLQAANLLKAFRLVRTVRILRLVKFARLLDMLRDQINSEHMLVLMNIMNLAGGLVGMTHLLSGLWYAIGVYKRSLKEPNWIDAFGLPGTSLAYRYLTSLHFSLTQFTPASMEVSPQNALERLYAIVLLMCGLVIFSTFISSITQNMLRLTSLRDKKSGHIWLLRKYLRQHKVSGPLFFRVLRFLEYKFQAEENYIPESKVVAITMLSDALRRELQYAVSFSCLKAHAFLDKLGTGTVMQHLLGSNAISAEHFATDDCIFHHMERASDMYCIECGRVQYTRVVLGAAEDALEAGASDWLAEAAMWTEWFFLGTAFSLEESKAIIVNVTAVANYVKETPVAFKLSSVYAMAFLQKISSTAQRDLSDLTRSEQMLEFGRDAFEHKLDQEMAKSFKTPKGLRRVLGGVSFNADPPRKVQIEAPRASLGSSDGDDIHPADSMRARPSFVAGLRRSVMRK
eukprot:TRINITY_DN36150_c0_g1_i1.p1 TRINITY_DN36150_c0_g1~~TRINITY_DN36150_c0_g1_i1.p1  ORF type:complete len:895 (-),score=160.33 TRINITY_DN36150_c0_g1_i1:106-2790(-)